MGVGLNEYFLFMFDFVIFDLLFIFKVIYMIIEFYLGSRYIVVNKFYLN